MKTINISNQRKLEIVMKESIRCQMESIVESINLCDSLDNSTKMSLVNIVTETAGYTNGHQDKMQAITEASFKEAALLSLTNIKIAENQKSLEDKIDSLRKDIQSLAKKIDTNIKCQLNIENSPACPQHIKTSSVDAWVDRIYRFRWPLTFLIALFMMLASISPRIADLGNNALKKSPYHSVTNVTTNAIGYSPTGLYRE